MVNRVHYNEDGICTTCGHPGSGFVSDGVCHCLDEDSEDVISAWLDELDDEDEYPVEVEDFDWLGEEEGED